MALATPPKPLARLLTTCCAAAICAAAAAQTPAPGAEICTPGRITIPAELKNALRGERGDPAGQPIHVEADTIETEDDNVVILRGSAEVVQGNRGVYAERIVYHRGAYRARAEGGVVYYTAGGDEIRAGTLDVEVDTFVGTGSDVQVRIAGDASSHRERERGGGYGGDTFFSPLDDSLPAESDEPEPRQPDGHTYARARATAQTVDFEGGDFQRLHNVTLTTCEPGNTDVLLSAKEIELDHAAGVGTAKSMTVKFKNTPIFYFPTATFPINDERKTGFLFPAAGYDNESGAVLETPYYLNLAPHYDATLTPRILTERGAQLFGEFRYLGENGRGAVRGEYLPSDNEYEDGNEDRYAFGYDHRHRFGENWRATLDWQRISDSDYLRDFANEVDVVASSYVPQKAALEYFGKALRFSARAAAYDSANDAINRTDRPYQTLPQLSLAFRPQKLGRFRGGVDAQYTNFRHDDDDKVNGTRLRVKPYLSATLEKSYGYITPKVSLQAIRYSLDDNDGMPADDGKTDDSPAAEIPVYSIDGRLFFERQLEYHGAAYAQTLEPRLFYLNIPKKREQDAFPDFDTSAGSDSSFAHFFRENRFFGGDRVGDTEQIAVGVSSRILDNDSGRQRLKLSLGQVFYLEDREIALTRDAQAQTEDASGLLGEITAALSGNWSATGFARWDDGQSDLDTFRLSADYRDRRDRRDRRRSASAAYTFNDDFSEQLNAAFETPLGPRWRLQSNAAYSLEEDEVQSSGLGFSYDGCCWAVRVAARRYLDGEGGHKNRLVFTFELDDLGKIRSRL